MNKKGNNITWTDLQVARLQQYWQAGLTAGEISKLIPDKSRSAILGKIKRNSITKHKG